MTTEIKTPELYHIKHPLSDRNMSPQALASFSDSDVAEYRSEFEEYRRVQGDAVTQMHELTAKTRQYFNALFGNDSKQYKYLDRMIRNGELLTDQHAHLYPNPRNVESAVEEARKQYCNFLSEENAPKVGGDDTLIEINNATAFLLEKGLSLNVDFTISNAVALAESIASESFDDALDASGQITFDQYNIVLKGMDVEQDKFSVYEASSNHYGQLRLRCLDMNLEMNDSLSSAVNNQYHNYAVSFKEMSNGNPQIVLCEA